MTPRLGKRSASLVALTVVLYILLFSSFALFHAYANDELLDPKGCQIGLWVQHSQPAVFGIVLIFAALAFRFSPKPFERTPNNGLVLSTVFLRAPPVYHL